MKETDKVVHKIARARENKMIFATLGEYKGTEVASLRIHYLAADGLWKPTPKGISIAVGSFHEIEAAVKAIRAELDARAKRPRKESRNESIEFRERYRKTLGNQGATEPTPLGEIGAPTTGRRSA